LTIDFAKGGLMNSWPNEALAECHRQRIIEEMEQIHLERFALKSHPYRPRAFGRAMFNFGNWMVSTGRQLCKRYEIPKTETIYE
jgi:hypothetical protein